VTISASEAREAVRIFIAESSGDGARAEEIGDRTPLVERRLLTSLMVADLLLFIEELRGVPIEASSLGPGCFKDIDTIVSTFFEEAT
jgi:hypothetical protein